MLEFTHMIVEAIAFRMASMKAWLTPAPSSTHRNNHEHAALQHATEVYRSRPIRQSCWESNYAKRTNRISDAMAKINPAIS